jgi:siroheme synthase
VSDPARTAGTTVPLQCSSARSADTLVLLMAVANLTRIAQCLLELGKPPGTPVACIEQAATARQQITRCTLHDLARPAKAPAIGNPAVIVIGPTGLGLAAIQTADNRNGEAVLTDRSRP